MVVARKYENSSIFYGTTIEFYRSKTSEIFIIFTKCAHIAFYARIEKSLKKLKITLMQDNILYKISIQKFIKIKF